MSHCHDGHDHHGHDHSEGAVHDHTDDLTPALQNHIYEQIDFSAINTLNESESRSGSKIVQKTWADRLNPEPELKSDADEQLLMHIPFTAQIRLHSVLIHTSTTPSAPATLKIFLNRDGLDFSTAADLAPTQKLDLPQSNDVQEIPVKRALFNTVRSLDLFFEDNWGHGDEDETRISYIGFKGEWMKLSREPNQREVTSCWEERLATKSHHILRLPGPGSYMDDDMYHRPYRPRDFPDVYRVQVGRKENYGAVLQQLKRPHPGPPKQPPTPLRINRRPHSKTVILFFSGYFSIGATVPGCIPEPLTSARPHYIAPTLPGNGRSSSTPRGVPYHVNLCSAISALLEPLHPSDNSHENAIQKLYVAGGSYGTVQAQMIYDAAFSLFPYGRKIAGVLLAAPLSPFKHHRGYAKELKWSEWILVGPPSQWIPFRLVQRAMKWVISLRCKEVDGTEKFFDKVLWSKMGEEEKIRFETFAREKRGTTAAAMKRQMAEDAMECIKNWDGILEGPDVLHSDWGFGPGQLDEEHARKPVLVMVSDEDELGIGLGEWLVEQYGNSRLKSVEGGHIAALWHMDEVWAEMLEMQQT